MLIADGVGDRLREERERLGLNQTDFGMLLGVSRGTQKNYELGANSLDLRYVSALTEHKVDAAYVLSGHRSPSPGQGLAPEEAELVEQFRRLPPDDQKTVRRIVRSMAAEADGKSD
ncbi:MULTISPECIES: helix-turn-helix domain-containing protein [Pseudomonas]|uniref:Helix-turn-helix domain-containing protein n=1 Tax=Pseudomonas azadiae TaxID=2843612 RepID=A0ABS6NVR3_9PSED|nr:MULTISPECIES: helix-turn-helix domain-containing protein [Pseudomonas]MBV4452104.1 helix-turn-helix domain-containing protein [Pseudomonas azadiae]NMF39324.1 helix-turn-helix domain-containing protein [Pseudomonas sp. SWRI 103]